MHDFDVIIRIVVVAIPLESTEPEQSRVKLPKALPISGVAVNVMIEPNSIAQIVEPGGELQSVFVSTGVGVDFRITRPPPGPL